jgi:hypothetical protein
MRRTIASLSILGLLASSPACGEVTSSSTFFSVICKIDQAIGFNWRNNEWVEARFKPPTYVISKFDASKNTVECSAVVLDTDFKEFEQIRYPSPSTGIGISKGCYHLKMLGLERDLLPVGLECDEMWTGKQDNSVLHHVICEDSSSGASFQFQINGTIVLTNTYSPFVLKPLPEGGRDSITLEIGKCAQIP